MSVEHIEARSGAYADSVTLMQVSAAARKASGVEAAFVGMGTELNLGLVAELGFPVPAGAGPSDLIVAVRAAGSGELGAALAVVSGALAAPGGGTIGWGPAGGDTAGHAAGSTAGKAPRTVGAAARAAGPGLALISVPGQHAFTEAMDALTAGCDVMIFSDNVPVEQEIVLKDFAAAHGLLVMGPDCGTAVVGGIGLGFSHSVRPGPAGLVAASGTGAQQVLCLLDAAGTGVRAVLGAGGRDLSDEVGGRSARAAMDALDADPGCELIMVISKPPGPNAAAALRAHAEGLATPVCFAFTGPGEPDLTAATEEVLVALGKPVPQWPRWPAAPGAALPGPTTPGGSATPASLTSADDTTATPGRPNTSGTPTSSGSPTNPGRPARPGRPALPGDLTVPTARPTIPGGPAQSDPTVPMRRPTVPRDSTIPTGPATAPSSPKIPGNSATPGSSATARGGPATSDSRTSPGNAATPGHPAASDDAAAPGHPARSGSPTAPGHPARSGSPTAPHRRVGGRWLRGLYAGGTLCDEAMVIASALLGPVRSNIPLRPEWRADARAPAQGHTMIDFGDDEFTAGRPHPMIDQTLRLETLAAQLRDPEAGVILMDVVLGHAAHPGPAGELAPVIAAGLAEGGPPVVVSLIGAASDPQDLAHQADTLARAGADVFASNAEAARFACTLIGSGT